MNTSRIIEVGVDTGLEGFNAGKQFIRSAIFDATSLTPGGSGGTNDVQTVTITGVPTGGTFALKRDGVSTSAIPYNATNTQVRSALEALPGIGLGDVIVTGGPGPGTAFVVTYINHLGHSNQSVLVGDATLLTGGTTPTVAVAHTITGSNVGWDPRILVGTATFPTTAVMKTGKTPDSVKEWDGVSPTAIFGVIDGSEEFMGLTSNCNRNVAVYGGGNGCGLVINGDKLKNYQAYKANFDTWAASRGVTIING